MNKEILLVAELVANEKNIAKEDVFLALEATIVNVAKKKFSDDEDVAIEAHIDRNTGEYEVFRLLGKDPDVKKEKIDVVFGRIAIQSAKNIIAQKIREAERRHIATSYADSIGKLFYGRVKKNVKDGYIVSLEDKVEGLLPRDKMLPQDYFRAGDRVVSVLDSILPITKSVQLLLSRTADSMLAKLLSLEVPEVEEQIVIIKAIARDPGLRAKVAIKTNDKRIDPIGACIGIRGRRVQAVSDEFGGERIDIIQWDENIGQLVINALSPAEVLSVVVDQDSKTVDVGVQEDGVSIAIGKNGQNVKLVSSLTGFTVNIMNNDELSSRKKKETDYIINMFMTNLQIEEHVAKSLCLNGFSMMENIVHADNKQLLTITGLSENEVKDLVGKVKTVLLNNMLSKQKSITVPDKELLVIEGIDPTIASLLVKQGIVTVNDLADLSSDELVDITNINEILAADIVMQARQSWFKK